ncbi:MAG: glycosyltransferase family 4 protein [Pseudomonadota bacterium]
MGNLVLLVSHGFQPSYEKGFANGLARNGLEVELIGSDRTPASDIDSSVKIFNLRGSQDPSRPKFQKAMNLLSYLAKLGRHLLLSKAQVLHLNGMLLGGTGWAALIECHLYKLSARKFFLTVHNLLPHGNESEEKKVELKRLYAVPHKLVVHTEQMKRALIEEYEVAPERVVVMHHGVDEIPKIVSAPEPGVALRVLIFGGVLPYKGVDIFLKALAHCSAFPIVAKIVGESRNAQYAKEIRALIDQVNLPHRVEWVQAFVPEADVQHYFESADVVVLPYRYIDQSGVLFTAYRFGVPVVAFDVGAFKEYLPPYAGLLVTEKSPEALAEALSRFYTARSEYSREVILNFADSYSWEKTVRILMPHYVG